MDRYQRQYILPGFGRESQQKLAKAKVLVIGAGGLGCPALLYLAAAGVGHIGIVDGDLVSISNLNRQVLFGEKHVGLNKAMTAASIIQEKYSDISVVPVPTYLNAQNAWEIISQYDLVVDGSDNFPTRYLVNDACVLLKKPIVFGAIFQHQGQVGILNANGSGNANYRDIYPDLPSAADAPNCSETGVLGVLPGIIGTMQAAETIKWLTGVGKPLADRMLFYHLMDHSSYEITLTKNPASSQSIPRDRSELESMDYAWACGDTESIEWHAALELLRLHPTGILVDVRESHELPKIESLPFEELPLSKIGQEKCRFRDKELVLLFCQTGVRSLKAMKILQREFPGKKIHSIAGGIAAGDSPINYL